jgi:adiponectin receptor
VGLFVGFGALGVVPLLHLLVFHRYNALSISLLGGVVGEGGVYLGGALIYTTQVPEALVPNRFDYSLNSHNLWHCCVVAAAYLHFKTMVELWEATSMAIGAAGV